jgi:hypothetical protein
MIKHAYSRVSNVFLIGRLRCIDLTDLQTSGLSGSVVNEASKLIPEMSLCNYSLCIIALVGVVPMGMRDETVERYVEQPVFVCVSRRVRPQRQTCAGVVPDDSQVNFVPDEPFEVSFLLHHHFHSINWNVIEQGRVAS